MKKAKILAAISLMVMLAGVIVAFSAEMGTVIYDGTIPADIGLHTLVIMIFAFVSTIILVFAGKVAAPNAKLTGKHAVFFTLYALAGIAFSVASAYQSRANVLNSYYDEMNDAPSWYFDPATDGGNWFNLLPGAADRFSSFATIFYVIMFAALIAAAILVIQHYKPKEVHQTASSTRGVASVSASTCSTTQRCPNCGAKVKADLAYCTSCGTPLGRASSPDLSSASTVSQPTSTQKAVRSAICPHCGAKHVAGTEKCKYCGTPMR